MRIGLITIYQVPNFGSVLQTYATQILLEELGIECKIINYRYPNEWHWSQGLPKPRGWKSLLRRIIPSKRTLAFKEFRNKYFNFTTLFNNLEELKAADWSSYNAFVVGSDQVWNVRYLFGDSVFMLSFAPDDKPKYSLASSFALKHLPDVHKDKYKKELSKFSSISVRESNGINIINDDLFIDKPVKVLLDPTLWLSRDTWLKIVPRSSFKKKRPYIVFYMMTYAFEPRPYIFEVVKHFQKQIGCDVLTLEGYFSFNECGVELKDYSKSRIEEFIDILINADLVVTSSFHGTAFALNFGIPLVSIIPGGNSDDRQTTLIKNVGCEQCVAEIGTHISNINPYYDVAKEQDKLDKMRQDNITWIKENVYDKTFDL